MKQATLIIAVALLAPLTGFAQTDTARRADPPAEPPPYVVRIDSVVIDGVNISDTIDIMIDSFGSGIAGCALKVATDHYGLDIVEIIPGEFPTACRWKMFNARELSKPAAPGQTAPAELWQITALANTDPTADTAICYQLDHPATLARVVVMDVGVSMGFKAPLFFYWESCRDNVISDPSGSSVIISDSVVDRFPVELTTERNTFPTRYGTPDECISPRAQVPPQRRIRFVNGGIEYRSGWEETPVADSVTDSAGH